MKAGITNSHAGIFFNRFILILTKRDTVLQNTVWIELFVEVTRVATHVADQVEHPGPYLRIFVGN
jgi:hypothetical protein